MWFSDEHTLVRHYLIVKYGSKGFELPDILSHSGEVILPIFSSEQAAREFFCLSPFGNRWCVRGFSGGELASVLFAFHARAKGVLLDPHPGALSGDVAVSVVGRDAFVSSLLESRSHQPPVGARL
jgi:hypothetical protein